MKIDLVRLDLDQIEQVWTSADMSWSFTLLFITLGDCCLEENEENL